MVSVDIEAPHRGPRRRIDRALVKQLFEQHRSAIVVHRLLAARGINCHYNTVRGIITGRLDARQGKKTKSRFPGYDIGGRLARMPAIDNPAIWEKRTMYPKSVVRDLRGVRLFKSGQHQSKIGGVVRKGRWKGMPIYTLTLEERATCPVSCRHFRSCYGNGMNWSDRISHEAPGFERALEAEVRELSRKHRPGFVVRLHILGDFYSVEYVKLWHRLLIKYPQLFVFGYTARHGDDIGLALREVVRLHWDRFAMRFSNSPEPDLEPATITIEHPVCKPADAVICPEQTGKTESCSTCGICWHTSKRVAFLQH